MDATAIGKPSLTAIVCFVAFIAATLVLTYVAARRTRSSDDFFAAGRRITAGQNGLALAGDFLSAAGVLGVGGLVALAGFDGLLFCIGAVMGFALLLLLLAEPLRNLGLYTFTDVLSFRLGSPTLRTLSALISLVLVLMYMILQMVGAGSLVHLMFGIDYVSGVVATGAIMLVYVLFGGMIATTWVQIIKTVLMLVAFLALAGLTLQAVHFDLPGLFAAAAAKSGPAVLLPGRAVPGALELLSLGLTMPLGVASLPHVLIRFYTVPDARAARRSVLYATGIIAVVQLLIFVVGYGAMVLVGPDLIRSVDRGGNMALPLLALQLAGTPFLGFFAAVSFSTILAVVSGVVITGATTVSHDLWASLRPGAGTKEILRVARVATFALCVLGVLLGIVLQGQNLAFLVGLSTAVAGSAVFPVLLLAVYWSRLTAAGGIAAMLVGLLSSALLVFLSPLVQVDILHHAAPILDLRNPGIVSFPLALAAGIVVSLLSPRNAYSRFVDVQRRMLLGASRP